MSHGEDYLLDRAEWELTAARAAAHPRAASAHFHLAGLLFDRFFGKRDEIEPSASAANFDAPQAASTGEPTPMAR